MRSLLPPASYLLACQRLQSFDEATKNSPLSAQAARNSLSALQWTHAVSFVSLRSILLPLPPPPPLPVEPGVRGVPPLEPWRVRGWARGCIWGWGMPLMLLARLLMLAFMLMGGLGMYPAGPGAGAARWFWKKAPALVVPGPW